MHQTLFRSLIIILLLFGITVRFTNLGEKFYWVDEVFTSLRISGYTEQEVGTHLYQKPLLTVQDLGTYQAPAPEKSAIDTIRSLANHEPQLPPLYFVCARVWAQLFGSSEAAIRSLSAVFSVLVFPALYGLSRELFASSQVAWLAVGLFAVSPFQVVYAQEARPYSLWTLTIVLASWALLRALRRQTGWSWAVYASLLALSFYTFLYSVFVAIGHGIYVLVRHVLGQRELLRHGLLQRGLLQQEPENRAVFAYLVATIAAGICFLPWINVLLHHWSATSTYTGWQSIPPDHGIAELIVAWGLNLTRVFIDFDLAYHFSVTQLFPYGFVVLAAVGLIGYALYFLSQTTPPGIWVFVFTLIGSTGLAVVLPDLLSGGQRSGEGRYFMPCWIGIELAVAYLFARKLDAGEQSKLWRWGIAAVFAIGMLACVNYLSAPTWWNKKDGYIPAVAAVVNQASNPVILNELDFWLFSLSHSLRPDIHLLVFDSRGGIPALPAGYSDYFLFNASELLTQLMQKQGYQLESVPDLEETPFVRIVYRP